MKFDTAKAKEDAKGALHPEGTWDGTVTGQEVKKTKTDRDMIVLTWKTSKGKLRSYHVYVEEYPGLFLKPMYAMGLTEEYFNTDPELEDVAMELLKKRALLDVVHDEYQGNPTSQIKSISAIPDNGILKAVPEAS